MTPWAMQRGSIMHFVLVVQGSAGGDVSCHVSILPVWAQTLPSVVFWGTLKKRILRKSSMPVSFLKKRCFETCSNVAVRGIQRFMSCSALSASVSPIDGGARELLTLCRFYTGFCLYNGLLVHSCVLVFINLLLDLCSTNPTLRKSSNFQQGLGAALHYASR